MNFSPPGFVSTEGIPMEEGVAGQGASRPDSLSANWRRGGFFDNFIQIIYF
jgi:hypothetical protein